MAGVAEGVAVRTRRTHSIIDSQGLVLCSVRFSAPQTPEAGDNECLLHALAQRPGGFGMGVLERDGELLEALTQTPWSSSFHAACSRRLTAERSRSGR